ncbi:MAG: hypothetical protein V1855_04020, partial [bacterium]
MSKQKEINYGQLIKEPALSDCIRVTFPVQVNHEGKLIVDREKLDEVMQPIVELHDLGWDEYVKNSEGLGRLKREAGIILHGDEEESMIADIRSGGRGNPGFGLPWLVSRFVNEADLLNGPKPRNVLITARLIDGEDLNGWARAKSIFVLSIHDCGVTYEVHAKSVGQEQDVSFFDTDEAKDMIVRAQFTQASHEVLDETGRTRIFVRDFARVFNDEAVNLLVEE